MPKPADAEAWREFPARRDGVIHALGGGMWLHRWSLDGRPMALGLWIYGDGSGNSPRMRFTDATGQCFQPTAPDLKEKGWRYVEFALQAAGAGYWGGASDGIIHYPIHLDTLLLVDSPARKGTAGTIHLASPVLVYPAGQYE